ncbi:hypothetical protein [Robertmurraya kyonggiensis]|uniref:DUF3990 domain-containing protein n=1 Tax=Robertmurraya kyonggiensis TaxID=1037680 RepID=A0A4V5P1K8_9BACI|nr:hypothetical protein [Robertmurraya kyonggiensis]TKC16740.1 hypothetical protein FA727_11760 [Robertmurraya kyonggiensis]
MEKLILFHGNTESAINEIINSGNIPEKFISKGDTYFLGDGFYFYNDSIQAKVWAKMKVSRNTKYIGQNWAVLKCEMFYNEELFLDLDKREEQNFFFDEMVRLNDQILAKDLEIEEYNDAYLCNHLTNRLDLEILTKTFVYKDKHKTLPTLFSNKKNSPYSITRHFRTEKQYAIKQDKLIISFEKIESGKSVKKGRGEAN